jgi:hypothetical protein
MRLTPTDVPRAQPGEQGPPATSHNYGRQDDYPVVDDQ